MRRYDDQHPGRVLANLDDSLTKDVLLAAGWADVDPPWEALFDLWLDPSEGNNRIDDPALAGVARGPPRAAARLDGADRGSAHRRTGASGGGHDRQHGRSGLGQRPHDAAFDPQPHTLTAGSECGRGSGLKRSVG